ncbi:haloacid dehalogenase-like hydrolase [bacterium]|nr:haloacid dehalogenase-like hydrolase [bacterium]
MIVLGAFAGVQAASREEIAAVRVSKRGNFHYWNKDSRVIKELVSYVRDVTDRRSRSYIPVEDRLAVFDLDGTLICETAPCYFEWMMYLERALYDDSFTPSEEDREYARIVEAEIQAGHFSQDKFPSDMSLRQARSQEAVFSGMTDAEYEAFVRSFMEKPVSGLSGLKYGEGFYLPMVEIVRYLQAHNFTVYIVSGTDRALLRILSCDVLNIKPNHVIGTDTEVRAAHQGEQDGLDYFYRHDDYIVRGQLIRKNLKMNKVHMIAREIGKQPVLAFGNSSGDSSMLNYTISGNKYRSAAFMVLCDDLERELGSMLKADKCRKLAEDNGWIPVSMKNDFRTIYGDKVTRCLPARLSLKVQ